MSEKLFDWLLARSREWILLTRRRSMDMHLPTLVSRSSLLLGYYLDAKEQKGCNDVFLDNVVRALLLGTRRYPHC